MRGRLIVAGCLGAAVLGVAGCGSSSSSTSSSGGSAATSTGATTTTSTQSAADFTTQVNQVFAQFKAASVAIGHAIQSAPNHTDAALATQFKSLAAQWQAAASKLQTLTPPPAVATTFNTLSSAANRAESDLGAIVAAAETHSASAAKQASATLVGDIVAARAAAQKIQAKVGSG
jgi:hypothetical protein